MSGVSERSSHYWRSICERASASRPPVLSLAFVLTIIIVYYAAGEGTVPGPVAAAMRYIPGPNLDASWYRSLSASFSHLSAAHLWMNAIMLLVAGSFFEITEGIPRTAAVLWGSANLGFAFHGVFQPDRGVRGASAATYGILFAQIALLALNWSEMPLRWARTLVLALLIGLDVGLFWFNPAENTAYETHLFAALAGTCVALVLGRNVNLKKWELSISWAGVVGYAVMAIVAMACKQVAAGLLAAALVPVLAGYAWWLTRKAPTQFGRGAMPKLVEHSVEKESTAAANMTSAQV